MKTILLQDFWSFYKLPSHTLEEAETISLEEYPSQTVLLPHTWFEEENPYQGLCLYEKTIPCPKEETLLLSVGAADQSCRIYVNGVFLGSHQGGYSRFTFLIPKEARKDKLQIRVYVENRLKEEVCPSFGDFTVFGGLYRDVMLYCLTDTYFDRTYYGTEGLLVRTEPEGILHLEPHVVSSNQQASILYTVTDPDGRIVANEEAPVDTVKTLQVQDPQLWDGLEKGKLYRVDALLRVGDQVVDEVSITTGFRSLYLSPESGLSLNGRKYPLHGVAKHQDRAVDYCAVSDKEVQQDFDLIKEIGANAVRLSHYQHPQKAYEICDERGLLSWAEIPMLKMTENKALFENTKSQLTELILQNLHHPSIFCWGIQNEIAMFKDATYMHENCRALADLVKELDPSRYSAAANLYPLKASSKMNEQTDLVGYNLYFGWYYGEMEGYGPYLDKFHKARPMLPFGITEYGVDANLSLHSETPKVKDYSEEYQALFHETVYPQIESRPYLWGSFIWNMFDFSSMRRNEGGIKYINAKGLVTHDRKIKKDAFYYYKAKWSKEPFVHLCGHRFVKRAVEAVDVKVYTNQPVVCLKVNGKAVGEKEVVNGTAVFAAVPLRMGVNLVAAEAVSQPDLRDNCIFERVAEEEESYRLPEVPGGGAVKNWFLSDDDITKQGYFSLNSTANELLNHPDTRKILEETIPDLVKFMTEKDVIPLGLTLKNILSREADGLDLKALNARLNEIVDDEV